jgi:hypothetical protein
MAGRERGAGLAPAAGREVPRLGAECRRQVRHEEWVAERARIEAESKEGRSLRARRRCPRERGHLSRGPRIATRAAIAARCLAPDTEKARQSGISEHGDRRCDECQTTKDGEHAHRRESAEEQEHHQEAC